MEKFSALLPLFKAVLSDWRVIGTAVVVLLVMNFGAFVANYVKKPKPIRKRKVAAPKPAPAPKEAASQEGEDEESDSEQEAEPRAAK